MATNDITLKVSSNLRTVSLDADSGSPYYVGARAYVTQTEHGATITIIDKEGTTTATVDNGKGITDISLTGTSGLVDTYTITFDDGSTDTFEVTNGRDGVDGVDGFSPTATVTKVGHTATITITDENGTTTAEVYDGDSAEAVQSDWDEIDNTKPDYIKNKPTIPTKVSDLTNDSGFLTTETDPTVPSWAKQNSKPTYTAAEVGAVPTTRTVNGKALSSNISITASDVGIESTDIANWNGKTKVQIVRW